MKYYVKELIFLWILLIVLPLSYLLIIEYHQLDSVRINDIQHRLNMIQDSFHEDHFKVNKIEKDLNRYDEDFVIISYDTIVANTTQKNYMVLRETNNWYGKKHYDLVTSLYSIEEEFHTFAEINPSYPYNSRIYIFGVNEANYHQLTIKTSWNDSYKFDVSGQKFVFIVKNVRGVPDENGKFEPIHEFIKE